LTGSQYSGPDSGAKRVSPGFDALLSRFRQSGGERTSSQAFLAHFRHDFGRFHRISTPLIWLESHFFTSQARSTPIVVEFPVFGNFGAFNFRFTIGRFEPTIAHK
jgi:chromosome condensin MukBEF MukE localization factor